MTEHDELIEDSLRVEIDGFSVELFITRHQNPVRGGSGRVNKAYANINGKIKAFAIKICEGIKVMPREHVLWKSLSHKNILRLCATLEHETSDLRQRKFVFVSPYMKRGNLVEYLKFNVLTPRLPLMTDIASGLAYLHNTMQLVHGDIKAENVLIADDGRALLADFGLSTTVAMGAQPTAFDVRHLFTWAYCAPEIIDDNAEYPCAPGVKRSKTKMSDMYAYGLLLYQTYAGGLPRSQTARMRLILDMYDGKFPKRQIGRLPVFCDDLWLLFTRCCRREAVERPGIAVVLEQLEELASSPKRQMVETASFQSC